jgi:hypothetical protein
VERHQSSTRATASPGVDLLERTTESSQGAEWSSSRPLDGPGTASQATLDRIIWHAVPGAASQPPPVGPGASREDKEFEVGESTTAGGPEDDD